VKDPVSLRNIFHKEIMLLRGRHKNLNTHQSVLFFTIHKGGSTYATKILTRLVNEIGLNVMNFGSYYWLGGRVRQKAYQHNMLKKEVYKNKGYFYASMSSFRYGIPGMDKFKIILMLRDPRDVLVSEYFSIAYSHPLPPKENLKALKRMSSLRDKAQKMTIDEFVLDQNAWPFSYHAVYSTYIQELLNKPNVFFTKYEDMVTDFKTWLYAINDFMGINVKKDVIDQIISEADFGVDKEDIYSHKRQVTPGDHKRKLKPETIAALNIRFGSILDALGYSKE